MIIRTAKSPLVASTFAAPAAHQDEMQGAFPAIEIGEHTRTWTPARPPPRWPPPSARLSDAIEDLRARRPRRATPRRSPTATPPPPTSPPWSARVRRPERRRGPGLTPPPPRPADTGQEYDMSEYAAAQDAGSEDPDATVALCDDCGGAPRTWAGLHGPGATPRGVHG